MKKELSDSLFYLMTESCQEIIDTVRSCLAGDGDESTWQECALECERLADELKKNIESTYEARLNGGN